MEKRKEYSKLEEKMRRGKRDDKNLGGERREKRKHKRKFKWKLDCTSSLGWEEKIKVEWNASDL